MTTLLRPLLVVPTLAALALPASAWAQANPPQPPSPNQPQHGAPVLTKPALPALPHAANPVLPKAASNPAGPGGFQKRVQPGQPPPPAQQPAGVAPSVAGGPSATVGGAKADADTDSPKRAVDREELRKKGKFKLKFDKVDIEELVKQVADMTGRMFILPENIRGKISIIGPEHGEAFVSAEEVYAAFLSALDANGLSVYPTGKFLRIIEKRTAKNANIPTFVDQDAPYPLNESMVTKMFRVRYVEAEPIRGVVANLVTQNGDATVFPPDLIIINDQGLNMHRLEKVITQLDQPGGTDTIHVVQVLYATANDMVDKLNKIFEQKKGQPGQKPGQVTLQLPKQPAGGSAVPPPAGGAPAEAAGASDLGAATLRLVLADERTNKLIIVANDKSFDRILGVIKSLDVPTSGEGGVHVYYLQNAAAEELASTLSNLAQGSGAKAAKPGGKGNAAAELFGGEVKITAEKSTNSLVIIASDSDYRNVLKIIEKLDLSRREVFVEAVIMEVNLDHTNTWGARFHTGLPPVSTNALGAQGDAVSLIGDKFGNESLPPSFSLGSLASFGGFLAGIQGPVIPELSKLGLNVPSFGVVVHALEASSDVNVLSTPHILTTDNEEAEITVGQNVPFQAGFSPSSLGSTLSGLTGTSGAANPALAGAASGLLGGGLGSFFAPIQRQNVELKLKIKPQINEGDQVRMVIDEQTEEIASQDPVLGPTTSKRSAKTTIIVRDQQTVVIGGMIQERTIDSVNKVPVLGDIPVVGHLFREQQKHKLRTNLLLFLTPYIIRDQSDFQRIFQRKLKERQQFVEQFYGHDKAYEAYIDYNRKSGPISKMRAQLRAESNRIENGGTGAGTGFKAIVPGEKVNDLPSGPPSGRPVGGGEGGEGGAAPEGAPGGQPAPPGAPGAEGGAPHFQPRVNPEVINVKPEAQPARPEGER